MLTRDSLTHEMNWFLDLRFHRMRQLQQILGESGIALPDGPLLRLAIDSDPSPLGLRCAPWALANLDRLLLEFTPLHPNMSMVQLDEAA